MDFTLFSGDEFYHDNTFQEYEGNGAGVMLEKHAKENKSDIVSDPQDPQIPSFEKSSEDFSDNTVVETSISEANSCPDKWYATGVPHTCDVSKEDCAGKRCCGPANFKDYTIEQKKAWSIWCEAPWSNL
jgi:hypothetical protein